MKSRSIDILWLWISIVSFLIMSVMFLIMPLDNKIPELRSGNASVIVGICFWAFLLIGIFAQVILSLRRKAWYQSQRINIKRSCAKRIGAIAFFSNMQALIADLVGVVALIGLIISAFLTHSTGYICYVFLALLSFAFCMHCILNGKVYYHITHHFDERGIHERKSILGKNEEGDD